MNEYLLKHFLSLNPMTEGQITNLENAKCDTKIIALLNSTLDENWGYEVLETVMVEGYCHTAIALYLPGQYQIGFGISKVEKEKNFKFVSAIEAIKNACQMCGFLKGKIGLTPKQKEALNDFVKENDILNNTMLLKFIQTWNKNIKSIEELTADNADKFLIWAKENTK